MLRRLIPFVLFSALLFSASQAEVQELTLFQRTGRAKVVVWGKVVNHDNQKAVIRTIELIKCSLPDPPPETFRIAFRLESFTRERWEEKITFVDGEEVILFLKRPERRNNDKIPPDLYNLLGGARGRFTLPPEGGQAYVKAIQFFESVATEQDIDRQDALLISGIKNENPYIVIASFEEMLRSGIGGLDLIPDLLEFFDNPRDDFRVLAMRHMQMILTDAQVADRTIERKEDLADRIRGRAVLDTSADFRVEAVKVLGLLGGDESRVLLERLAKEDPAQAVRYEAEKLLIGWKPGT